MNANDFLQVVEVDSETEELTFKKHSDYKEQATEKYHMWRLIFEGGMSKKEVWSMDVEEIAEANAALDYHNEQVNKQYKI